MYLKWNPNMETNIWETSELFEGDIMLYNTRNAILNDTLIWPDAIVPYYIDPVDFDDAEIAIIKNAIEEYHEKTCVKFRPYEDGDLSWVTIKGNTTGCWSSIGMRFGGQILNLNPMKCVRHGTVVHELLHVLGFVHQQSSPDRDNYVKIIWDNIKKGKKKNFRKYEYTEATSFGVEYDYDSIMHYGRKAFSKNGEPTIVALKNGVKIGQRKKLSTKDVIKLQRMYERECKLTESTTTTTTPKTPASDSDEDEDDDDEDEGFFSGFLELFENIFDFA
ncbi:zinc metalloproteinase nas-14 [Condylostylus longicornis]|uniref:zinc metalloproteinase nas-14 n=1 Tax=Condylostylus longicornis TaxID=2530218 RepID=UPI00244E2D1E|nr:zinc metalloproteinase nas-14 [Condylostylus longicornis]